MTTSSSRDGFWRRWVVANALAELVGLGTVAAAGWALVRVTGEPKSAAGVVTMAAGAIALGALEGAVVGWAQQRVLRIRLPAIRGWVRATVLGAMAAWAVGMVPSTLVKLAHTPDAAAPQEPSGLAVVGLAAAMGAVAGPLLASFQWLSLRRALPRTAVAWPPANAAAWGVGMPIVFLGVQAHEALVHPALVALAVALALLLAGAAVGVVHGGILLAMIRREAAAGAATGATAGRAPRPGPTRRSAD
jgi:hypothetical protein